MLRCFIKLLLVVNKLLNVNLSLTTIERFVFYLLFTKKHYNYSSIRFFQIIPVPYGGVSSFPNNYFVIDLGDTVQKYEEQVQHAPSNRRTDNERTPLLPDDRTPLLPKERDIVMPEKTNKLIRRFGSYGQDSHQFVQVTGIAVSNFTDDIFVLDTTLRKIAVFGPTGQPRFAFTCDCSVRDLAVTRGGTLLVTVSQDDNSLLREYTTEGKIISRYGNFYSQEHPFGLTITKTGRPVVTGLRQNCVHVLTSQYKPSVRFGSRGRGMTHFSVPYYVTMTAREEIVVSDCGNHRIKIHSVDGTFLKIIGRQGSMPGELFYPMGVCVDKYDNIYVADANNYRVQAFSHEGECLGFPVKDTFEYGIDVKPVNVTFFKDNVLLVVLRGSTFCEIHAYFCDIERNKPVQQESWTDLCCCKC